jgi:aldose 1-epimerase
MTELLRFSDGDVELVVAPEYGGRIIALNAFGHQLMRTPENPDVIADEPYFWGSYPMVPWVNRIPGGTLHFDGKVVQLPADFQGHAIHGRAMKKPWTVASANRIEFSEDGSGNYPWPYAAWQEFGVTGNSAWMTIGVENTGTERMPAGLGIHPWWVSDDEQLEVRLPAELVYPSRDRYPVPGEPVPVSGNLDLRKLGAPDWDLDEIWTGLTENRIELHWRTWGLTAYYDSTPNCDHVVLATIRDIENVTVNAYAIEPQTHCTDGHRRLEDGERGGIDVLEPGEKLEVKYTFTVKRD